jgi:hypothetical protein
MHPRLKQQSGQVLIMALRHRSQQREPHGKRRWYREKQWRWMASSGASAQTSQQAPQRLRSRTGIKTIEACGEWLAYRLGRISWPLPSFKWHAFGRLPLSWSSSPSKAAFGSSISFRERVVGEFAASISNDAIRAEARCRPVCEPLRPRSLLVRLRLVTFFVLDAKATV